MSSVDVTPINVNVSSSLPEGSNTIGNVNVNQMSTKLNQDSSGNVGVLAIKPQNKAILLNGGSITTNTTWTYKPQSNKISVLIHITAVSGTSPTLTINVYAIDPAGNVLTGDVLASSSQFTTTGDQVINIDLYGVQEIQINAVVGGASPSFTGYISVEG